jgi:hypothetical protein
LQISIHIYFLEAMSGRSTSVSFLPSAERRRRDLVVSTVENSDNAGKVSISYNQINEIVFQKIGHDVIESVIND